MNVYYLKKMSARVTTWKRAKARDSERDKMKNHTNVYVQRIGTCLKGRAVRIFFGYIYIYYSYMYMIMCTN